MVYKLSDVLSRHHPGIYRLVGNWRSAHIDALCRLKGFQLYRVDASCAGSKQRLLRMLSRQMHLPAWFGHNWDALADALTDLPLRGPGAVLLLHGLDRLARHAPADVNTLLEVLGEAVGFWSKSGVRFYVLVDGMRAAELPATGTTRPG